MVFGKNVRAGAILMSYLDLRVIDLYSSNISFSWGKYLQLLYDATATKEIAIC